MNKTINKALFYKEWVNVRWVTLLTIIVILFYKGYGVISMLNANKTYIKGQNGLPFNNRWFNNGLHINDGYFYVMMFVVLMLSVILFIGEKTSETEGFIASMPFTRKEIILNKWFVGVLSLLISFVVIFIFLSLFYAININRLDATLNPYSDIVKWFCMDAFQYICIFTFIILAQAVMGNSIVAGIVGGVILMVPAFIVIVIQDVFMRGRELTEYTYKVFDKLYSWLNIYVYNLPQQNINWLNTESNSSNDFYRVYYYTNYKSKLLILFILTCLFLYLAYVAYKNRNLEYNLRLIVFKNLEPMFSGGFAICLGLFAGFSFETNISIFFILVTTFTILGYFISKLLLKVLSSAK
jgi:ABC-type transport system involved in multi-copper enzyme maturation permease subunit